MHDIVKMKDHDCKWIGALYKRGKKMIKFINNHGMAHHIFNNHSKLELLNIAKNKFTSYYLTFRHLLKVREALVSMVSSDSWQGSKDKVEFTSDKHEFQEVEDAVLGGQFWQQIGYLL